MFDIRKKVCEVIFFCCHEISKRRVDDGTKSNGLNIFSRIRRMVEQDLGHFSFYYLK